MSNIEILIINSKQKEVELIKDILKNENYRILSFSSLHKTIELALKFQPTLILLDYDTPSASSIAICRLLKKEQNLKKIPIIFFTHYQDEKSITAVSQAGANDFITKPLKKSEVIFRIKNIINQSNQLKNLQSNHQLLEKQCESNKILMRVVCHDLVNPLSVINFSLARLEREKYNELTNSVLRKIKKSYNNMSEIINNIKQIKSHEDNKTKTLLEPINIYDIINEAAQIFESKLEQKNITLTIQSDIGQETKIMAEKTSLLNSVINNVISNAIKFSFHRGKITISITQEDKRIVVKIKDNGIGMEKKLQKKIFQKYSYTSRSGTDGEQGTGYGMPLTKHYMNLFGGYIEILSQTEKEDDKNFGSTFILNFKIAC